MPYKEFKIEKQYYSIGEVAKMFKVNTSLIRFWEQEFDILQPRKTKTGNRLFTNKDVENLHVLYNLIKVKGFTLEGAKNQLSKKGDFEHQKVEIIHRLENLKTFLKEIKDNL